MNDETTARLGEALRREAAALPVGPAPVDAVLREGRRRRRRRRGAVGAATVVLGGLAGSLLLPALPSWEPSAPAAPPAAPAASPTPSATGGTRVVRPYEPVEIGQGALLGLLPEGRQNHVVAWDEEQFEESVERSKEIVGDSIRPDSLSGGYHHSPEHGLLYTGAWRTDVEPARITVTAAGRTWEAGLCRLPGDPGWGVYHVDAGHSEPGAGAEVTAYGPDGEVLARLEVKPFL